MPGPGEVELPPRGSARGGRGGGWEGGGQGLGWGHAESHSPHPHPLLLLGTELGSVTLLGGLAWVQLGSSGSIWTQGHVDHICLA